MQIKLSYGTKKIKLETSGKTEIVLPEKKEVENEKTILRDGFLNPVEKESFEKFVSSIDEILFIVNDTSRPTPSAKILDYILSLLPKNIETKFIVATGSHRKPTEDEMRIIFGKNYEKNKENIYAHDARDKDSIEFIGKTKNGTKVGINKLVFETKNVVTINSVEPHYFAGYTGGRKSFVPGVASYETIEQNHTAALKSDACNLKLKANPVHEDMIDAVKLIEEKINTFSVQVILTPDSKLYKIVTGDIFASFNKAVDYAKEIFCAPIKNKASIVITVAPHPMDINLYQSQKALENGKLALSENGVIILVSKCPDGVGPDKFMQLLSSAKTPEEVMDKIKEGYVLGYHKAAKIVDLAMHSNIYAVTDIRDSEIKKAFMKPYHNIQEAYNDAKKTIEKRNMNSDIIVLPFGSYTVPFVKK